MDEHTVLEHLGNLGVILLTVLLSTSLHYFFLRHLNRGARLARDRGDLVGGRRALPGAARALPPLSLSEGCSAAAVSRSLEPGGETRALFRDERDPGRGVRGGSRRVRGSRGSVRRAR